jgi:hypothetical protein
MLIGKTDCSKRKILYKETETVYSSQHKRLRVPSESSSSKRRPLTKTVEAAAAPLVLVASQHWKFIGAA